MEIKLEGRLDMDRCGELARTLTRQLQVGDQLQLDFSAVDSADSAALALILELQRTAASHSAQLRLAQLPAGLQSLITLYGLESLIQPMMGVH